MSQPTSLHCRPLAYGSTLDELLQDRDWARQRAEACVVAHASVQELPPAWHSAETAFQCLFRAVGVLQVRFLPHSNTRRSCANLSITGLYRCHTSPCVISHIRVTWVRWLVSCWLAV
jgi:hypothetical protein